MSLNSQQVASRTVTGIVLLVSRTGLMQALSLVGIFLLTQYLTPKEFGVFFLVNEVVGLLTYFSDVGLAASLIQKKDMPTTMDLRTTFTIQQVIMVSLCLVGFFLTPWIRGIYNWELQTVYLWYSLLAGFFIASLKTIPSVLIEKQLQFEKLILVETLETLVFYGLAVFLAMKGFGSTSYAFAVLARAIIGILTISWVSPWPIGFAYSKDSLQQLLKFGLPYQGNTFIAAIKDRFLNIMLGKWVGEQGLGYLGWAQTWSQKPLRFISDNVTRVTFPAFAMLQNEPEKLTSAINRMIFFSAVTVFPIIIGAAAILDPIIHLIPRYQKWQPAEIIFYLYVINSLWASISTPITNSLAAIGKIKTVSKLMIMWTILTWGIVAPLAYVYGYIGAAAGSAIISFASIIPIVILQQSVPFNFISNVMPGLVASLLMGSGIYWSSRMLFIGSWMGVIIAASLGGVLYVSALYSLAPQKIQTELTALTKYFKKNPAHE